MGDTFTAKGDYAALYRLMRERGWIGQFNHPATSGQFLVSSNALGYDANGRLISVTNAFGRTLGLAWSVVAAGTGNDEIMAARNIRPLFDDNEEGRA